MVDGQVRSSAEILPTPFPRLGVDVFVDAELGPADLHHLRAIGATFESDQFELVGLARQLEPAPLRYSTVRRLKRWPDLMISCIRFSSFFTSSGSNGVATSKS